MLLENELDHGLQPLKNEILETLDNYQSSDLAEVFDSVTIFAAQSPKLPNSTAFSIATLLGKQLSKSEGRRSTYAQDNIRASGVDLEPDTPLRRLFMEDASTGSLVPSVLNPTEHKVWGARLITLGNIDTVVQMAVRHDADEQETLPKINDYYNKRLPALHRLVGEAATKMSRSGTTVERSLRAWLPATPNAVIINIDHITSTQAIRHNSPLFLERIEAVTDAVLEKFKHLDIEIVRNNGDGENTAIWLPAEIRRDPAAVRSFVGEKIDPLLAELLTTFKGIRAASLPGYITINKRGQATTEDFWFVDEKARGIATSPRSRSVI